MRSNSLGKELIIIYKRFSVYVGGSFYKNLKILNQFKRFKKSIRNYLNESLEIRITIKDETMNKLNSHNILFILNEIIIS